MVPATLEVGEVLARAQNRERRDTYRSAEEQQLTWLRASTPRSDVIATLGAYAGHPTTKGTNGGIAHADWIGLFEKGLEERFGGIGLHFMTGTRHHVDRRRHRHGLPRCAWHGAREGRRRHRADRHRPARHAGHWEQPATNVPLTALGFPGFFDREFLQTPSTMQTGKSPDTAPCLSASAVRPRLPATAARSATCSP